MDRDPEQLRCPVCLEFSQCTIYDCRLGHSVCGQCSLSLWQCPECNVSYKEGKTRNLEKEAWLQAYKVDCPQKAKGCMEKSFVDKLEAHLSVCVYNGKVVNFCEQLGFNCDHQINLRDITNALVHFEKKHGFIFRRSTQSVAISLVLEDFKTVASSSAYSWMRLGSRQITKWTPVIIKLKDVTFLIITKLNEKTEMVSWLCVRLEETIQKSGGRSPGAYHVEFLIKDVNATDKRQDLTWKVALLDMIQPGQHLPLMSNIQIPANVLRDRYSNKSGHLLVNLSVTQSLASSTNAKWNTNQISVATSHIESAMNISYAGIINLLPFVSTFIPVTDKGGYAKLFALFITLAFLVVAIITVQ